MTDIKKRLEALASDPLLAGIKPPRKRPAPANRLVDGFLRIHSFYEENGRMPGTEGAERELRNMWQGILSDKKYIDACRPHDTAGILPGADDDIFDIPAFMRERMQARREADYVGQRVRCSDFERYEPAFKEIQAGLKSGRYRLAKFSAGLLKPGRYFVEDGVLGYLAAFDDEGINPHGNRDGRTRVIYENGTEADLRFKTITKNLSVTGYSVVDNTGMSSGELEKHFTVSDTDVESGTVYVLRSKSTHPGIASIRNLYKIGFTTTSVESRIANARREPTYLCADVEVVATWKVYNVKTSTFEALIHKLFDQVQLQLTIDGHTPKEWFVVPLHIIEEAIKAIISKQPVAYDAAMQRLVYT